MQIIFILLAIVAGAVLPIQAAFNVKMGKAVASPVYAAMISFAVGTIGLFIYTLFTKDRLAQLAGARQVDVEAWTAGILGAFYVTAVVILVPRLGAALTFGLVVAGQLAISLLLDQFGLFGLPIHHINWQRIIGILLIIGGVLLIRSF